MKTISKLAALAAFSLTALQAQAQFFEQVDYIGALSSDASKDWTVGWTNFNPKATNYPAPTDTTTLNGIDGSNGKKTITANLTLNATTVYLLKGMVVVPDGVTLTIPAGTIIRGKADVTASPINYATLVVQRGGKLVVNGTATSPVVFTSWKTTGRDAGDWGGIVLCGKARNNQGMDVQLEGFSNVSFDNQLGIFGGTDDNDNSGSLRYLRIEFAGLAFEPNREVNTLTMGSVGRGTVIDYVQASFGNDDAFEWFGGTVNCKHLISNITVDDDFDADFGYSGGVQFGIARKDTSYFDLSWNAPSGSSTSEGFECDNDAGGSAKQPYTSPVFSNITMIGPIPVGSTHAAMSSVARNAFRRGARLRRNSRVSIVNSIFMGYRNMIMFDGDSVLLASGVPTASFPNTTTGMIFRNNLIVNSAAGAAAGSSNNGLVEVASGNAALLPSFDAWIKDAQNANKIDVVPYTAGTVLVDPKNPTAPNFRPVSGSPALTGASFSYNRLTPYGVLNGYRTLESASNIMSYPNPATGFTTLSFSNSQPFAAEIVITDMQGRVVRSLGSRNFGTGNQEVEVKLEGLTNGMYFINLNAAQGRISHRIMVAR
jgi:hypothetical protein